MQSSNFFVTATKWDLITKCKISFKYTTKQMNYSKFNCHKNLAWSVMICALEFSSQCVIPKLKSRIQLSMCNFSTISQNGHSLIIMLWVYTIFQIVYYKTKNPASKHCQLAWELCPTIISSRPLAWRKMRPLQ